MRRMLHGLTLALVVASSALIAVGCGGLGLSSLEGLLPSGSGATSPFIGQFTLTSINVNGASGACPGTVVSSGISYPCEAIVRSFITGGTFNDTSPTDQVGSGTWTVSGSNLVITKNGVVTTGAVSFSADLSTFTFIVGVENMTWTKN